MLTSGDVEFEPPQAKIAPLGISTVALVAGHEDAHTAALAATRQELLHAPTTEVQRIATLYAGNFAAYRRSRAEAEVLGPLGLTVETFLDRQPTMSPTSVGSLTAQLQRWRLNAEAIVAGVDAQGAHIYLVQDPGSVVPQDGIGFLSIGIGGRHANSHFMFAKYTRDWDWVRAMLLTYIAKKRAEVAPGVGTVTDMFYIGPLPTSFWTFPEEVVSGMERIYAKYLGSLGRADQDAQKAMEEYVKAIQETQPPAAPQTQPPQDAASQAGGEPTKPAP